MIFKRIENIRTIINYGSFKIYSRENVNKNVIFSFRFIKFDSYWGYFIMENETCSTTLYGNFLLVNRKRLYFPQIIYYITSKHRKHGTFLIRQ